MDTSIKDRDVVRQVLVAANKWNDMVSAFDYLEVAQNTFYEAA